MSTDRKTDDVRRGLTDKSNQILEAVEDLHAMEKQKRTEPISSPPFHELAEEIRDKSREIFRIASVEEDLGDQTPPPDGTTIDEINEAPGAARSADAPGPLNRPAP